MRVSVSFKFIPTFQVTTITPAEDILFAKLIPAEGMSESNKSSANDAHHTLSPMTQYPPTQTVFAENMISFYAEYLAFVTKYFSSYQNIR